jgi:hypothetical protein
VSSQSARIRVLQGSTAPGFTGRTTATVIQYAVMTRESIPEAWNYSRTCSSRRKDSRTDDMHFPVREDIILLRLSHKIVTYHSAIVADLSIRFSGIPAIQSYDENATEKELCQVMPVCFDIRDEPGCFYPLFRFQKIVRSR